MDWQLMEIGFHDVDWLNSGDAPSEQAYQAVTRCFLDDLEEVVGALQAGLSVIIEADAELHPYLARWFRERADGPEGFRFEDAGHLAETRIDPTLLRERLPRLMELGARGADDQHVQEVLEHLRRLIAGQHDKCADNSVVLAERALATVRTLQEPGSPAPVVLLPHLDLMGLTQVGASAAAVELARLVRVSGPVVFLGLCSPSVPLAPLLAELFPVRVPMRFVRRAALPRLFTKEEAVRLETESTTVLRVETQMDLFQHVGRMTPVGMRRVLRWANRPQLAGSLTEAIARKADLLGFPRLPGGEPKIGGYHAVRRELQRQVIRPFERWLRDGRGRTRALPRGVLLYGPAGTGKTHFARWLAWQLKASFESVSGPELRSRWIGETERLIREIFDRAVANAPSIILFDEIDALGRARRRNDNSVDDAAVSTLLIRLNGLRSSDGVLVAATTNLLDEIDTALIRPGRFPIRIHLGNPTREDLETQTQGPGLVEVLVEGYADDLFDHLRDTQGWDETAAKATLVATIVEQVAPRIGDFSCDHVEEVIRTIAREVGAQQEEAGTPIPVLLVPAAWARVAQGLCSSDAKVPTPASGNVKY